MSAPVSLKPFPVLRRELEREVDVLETRWGIARPRTVAGGASPLSPVPGLSQRRSSTIAGAGE